MARSLSLRHTFSVILLCSLLLTQLAPTALAQQAATPLDRAATAQAPAGALFVENMGQFADSARFRVSGGDRTIWLADDGLWVTLVEQPEATAEMTPRLTDESLAESTAPRQGVNLKLSYVGANPTPQIEPFTRQAVHVSYFIGSDASRWQADVPVWGGVRYVDLYPGIDLEVTSEGGELVQRLVVRDAAALSQVKLRVEGAESLALGQDELLVHTAMGDYALPLLQVVGEDGAALSVATDAIE